MKLWYKQKVSNCELSHLPSQGDGLSSLTALSSDREPQSVFLAHDVFMFFTYSQLCVERR